MTATRSPSPARPLLPSSFSKSLQDSASPFKYPNSFSTSSCHPHHSQLPLIIFHNSKVVHYTMLTSIFSSFDALFAEYSYGQKLGFSLGSLKDSNSKAKVDEISSSTAASSSVESIQKKSSSSKPLPPPPPMRPRFAPEFDGVHCFESILPY